MIPLGPAPMQVNAPPPPGLMLTQAFAASTPSAATGLPACCSGSLPWPASDSIGASRIPRNATPTARLVCVAALETSLPPLEPDRARLNVGHSVESPPSRPDGTL